MPGCCYGLFCLTHDCGEAVCVCCSDSTQNHNCVLVLQFGVFLFFAGCVMLNTLFAILCLPETKGVPVEKVEEAWHG